MSQRKGGSSSSPNDDLGRFLNGLRGDVDKNMSDIARGGLPEPLHWRTTVVAPGPPPTFQVEIVNAMTGASIVLGTI